MAAIDAGTNTFRLLVADGPEAVLTPSCKMQEIPRLGEGFAAGGGRLQEAAMERGLAVMARFAARLDACRPDRIRAVATSVVREAGNGADFTTRVRRETGIPLEIISGAEEAALTALGVWRGLPRREEGPLFLFDIGGGSTEFTSIAAGGEIRFSRSYPFGVVKLTEKFLACEPPTAAAAAALTATVDDSLDELFRDLQAAGLGPRVEGTLVGSAGTMTTFAAVDQGLVVYDPLRVNGYELSRERLAVLHERLWRLPRRERADVPGLEPGRADVILAGGLIALRLMERLHFSRVVVSDSALLEGIAFSLYGERRLEPVCR